MNETQAKEQHLKDGKKALLELVDDTDINEDNKQYRSEALNEFLTLVETGKTDHINIQDDIKKEPEHFK
jgi:hypothetical protein